MARWPPPAMALMETPAERVVRPPSWPTASTRAPARPARIPSPSTDPRAPPPAREPEADKRPPVHQAHLASCHSAAAPAAPPALPEGHLAAVATSWRKSAALASPSPTWWGDGLRYHRKPEHRQPLD